MPARLGSVLIENVQPGSPLANAGVRPTTSLGGGVFAGFALKSVGGIERCLDFCCQLFDELAVFGLAQKPLGRLRGFPPLPRRLRLAVVRAKRPEALVTKRELLDRRLPGRKSADRREHPLIHLDDASFTGGEGGTGEGRTRRNQ